MLSYDLSQKGNIPIYEYLYICIRDDILSGRLKNGDRLPSKREMAADNGVAVITVENTYAQLLLEGFIESKPRKGYFVAAEDPVTADVSSTAAADHRPRTDEREAYTKAPEAVKIKYDFASGGLIYDSFPYSIWTRLMRAVLTDAEKEFDVAPPGAGILRLREAIAGYLYNARNLIVSPANVIIGPGTEYLHSVIMQLLGHSRIVAVEDPGYKSAGLIYENNGMKVLRIPVGEDGIRIDTLRDSPATLVHISPSHHFPTGAVMSVPHRQRLLKWAHDTGSYIIEDDYDSEFRFKGRPLPALMSLDRENVIYMNTFSGTLAPSIRMAYMVLPDALMDIYISKLSFLSGTVSTFDQLTMARFITLGYYERHIGRMRNRYKKLRTLYADALAASRLERYAYIEEDQAGLRMILNFKRAHPANDAGFLSNLESRGIRVSALNNYCYHRSSEYDHRFVMRYADIDASTVKDIFDEMAKCWDGTL